MIYHLFYLFAIYKSIKYVNISINIDTVMEYFLLLMLFSMHFIKINSTIIHSEYIVFVTLY